MTSIGFNLNFLNNKEQFIQADQIPYTKALVGLMTLTNMHRLFEKNDILELIKRAHILLPQQRIIDRFFTDDSLFSFEYEKLTYKFSLKDLKRFVGIEVLDASENYSSLAQWESKINNCIMIYDLQTTIGVLKGLKLSTFGSAISSDEESIIIDFAKKSTTHAIAPTEEYLAQAEFLGKTISDEFSENLFSRIKLEFPNKIEALELRKMPFTQPEFSFDAYPLKIQKTLWQHFWPEMEHFNDPDEREHITKLIYLAWLWANGFVMIDLDGFYFVDSRVEDFEVEDYELEGGGTNLHETYYNHGLDELAPILYNEEVAKKAIRPWESIDVLKRTI
ncbi:hypothetical protein [Gelidibacter maritimus]|uniref:Uncharacterized protein n=1 Tax=Gelidibacter maritimus TaxID=2761487 RepID=A0A7W2R2Z8_9FLAO|nr:hypothetical protein [Gelidibacter maritimus]MBA6151450.1 hypothetical protein [Gelidibacter maritimus]